MLKEFRILFLNVKGLLADGDIITGQEENISAEYSEFKPVAPLKTCNKKLSRSVKASNIL